MTTAGDLDTIISGCVPMNFLGGVGGITQEMLDFSTFTAHDEYSYTQKSYYANVSGDLFTLPGGALGFSFGLEHRTEDGYDSPDALINSGSTTGNARTATSGGYDLDEAYLELAIPVLSDVPFAKLLDFSLATRYSDYSNFGDTLNSKFGFRWKPIEDLLIRGNWSEGFRAPSIAELFAGQADSFPQVSDPCNQANFGNQTPPAQARCQAEGVPNGGYAQNNTQIRITVGGNPNLLPEKADRGMVVTDGGNLIYDMASGRIDEPAALATALRSVTGVVDHGLFLDLADEALIGTDQGVVRLAP